VSGNWGGQEISLWSEKKIEYSLNFHVNLISQNDTGFQPIHVEKVNVDFGIQCCVLV